MFGSGEAAGMLARIQSFPLASTLRISNLDDQLLIADKELADALALLPDGSWPAVTRIEPAGRPTNALPPLAAAHLARLCPRLQRVCFNAWYGGFFYSGGDRFCSALESLGAAHSTLEELVLDLSCRCLRPGSSQRVAAALARLRGLQKLDLRFDGKGSAEAAFLLPAALPALSALSSLLVGCPSDPPLPSLSRCPASLRHLAVRGDDGFWVLGTLRSAPQLAGVTRLDVRLDM